MANAGGLDVRQFPNILFGITDKGCGGDRQRKQARGPIGTTMDYYDAVHFLHLVGATAMFAGWAVEYRILAAGDGPSRGDRAALLGPIGMTTGFLTGVAMMLWRWGPEPFVQVAIGGVVLLVAVGVGAMIAVRKGRPSPAGKRRMEIASLGARTGVGLALLAIMAAKPDTATSVALLAFGLIAGLVPAVLRGNATQAGLAAGERR